MTSDNLIKTIRSQDIQTGLQGYDIPGFGSLPLGGMAARLALHIRGRGPVLYTQLKDIAHILFGVPNLYFDRVIYLLQSIEFIEIIGLKENRQIINTVPYFDHLYSGIGTYIENEESFSELEVNSIELLNLTSIGPVSKNYLLRHLDVNEKQLIKLVSVANYGSYLQEFFTPSSGTVFVSPLYFSEHPDELATLVGDHGNDVARRVFELLKTNPGWPLSVVQHTNYIGNEAINIEELKFLESLISKKVIQPPQIVTSQSKQTFLFTPKAGNAQIPIIEKDIYERAMAIISCVRHGQHFASYKIKSPYAIINALKRDKWLRATTSAREQYRTLAMMKICQLKPTGGGFNEVHLISNEENIKSIDLALEILEGTETIQNRGRNIVADAVLSGNLQYEEFLRSYSSVRLINQIPELKKSMEEVDILLEDIMKG